jgi:hypothetical protein
MADPIPMPDEVGWACPWEPVTYKRRPSARGTGDMQGCLVSTESVT